MASRSAPARKRASIPEPKTPAWHTVVTRALNLLARSDRIGWEWGDIALEVIGPIGEQSKSSTKASRGEMTGHQKYTLLVEDIVANSDGRYAPDDMPPWGTIQHFRRGAQAVPVNRKEYRRGLTAQAAGHLISLPLQDRLRVIRELRASGTRLTQTTLRIAVRERQIASGSVVALLPVDDVPEDEDDNVVPIRQRAVIEDETLSNVVRLHGQRWNKPRDEHVEPLSFSPITELPTPSRKLVQARVQQVLRYPPQPNARLRHMVTICERFTRLTDSLSNIKSLGTYVDVDNDLEERQVEFITPEEAEIIDTNIKQAQQHLNAIKKFRKDIDVESDSKESE